MGLHHQNCNRRLSSITVQKCFWSLSPLLSSLSPATSLSLLPSLVPATSLSLSLHSILLRWVKIISLTSLLLWTKSIQLHVFYCNSQTRKYCKILLNVKFEIFTLLSYFYSLMKILLASQHINCLPWTMIHVRVKFKLKVNLPHTPPPMTDHVTDLWSYRAWSEPWAAELARLTSTYSFLSRSFSVGSFSCTTAGAGGGIRVDEAGS